MLFIHFSELSVKLRVLAPLITRPGHFSDRNFFVTPAVTRFSILLSVINIDSLFVCLPVTLLSFLLLLCSGKLPLRLRVKSGVCNESYTTKKRNGHDPLLFVFCNDSTCISVSQNDNPNSTFRRCSRICTLVCSRSPLLSMIT